MRLKWVQSIEYTIFYRIHHTEFSKGNVPPRTGTCNLWHHLLKCTAYLIWSWHFNFNFIFLHHTNTKLQCLLICKLQCMFHYTLVLQTWVFDLSLLVNTGNNQKNKINSTNCALGRQIAVSGSCIRWIQKKELIQQSNGNQRNFLARKKYIL